MTDVIAVPEGDATPGPDPAHPAGPAAPAGPGPDAGSWRRRLLARALSVAVLLAVWWAVCAAGLWSELIVPPPGRVWDAFVQSVTTDGPRRGLSDHLLWEHLAASLGRIGRGMGWAIVVGLPLGLVVASVRPVRVVVEPYVSFLRSLPPLAYFSLLIIWFGIDDTSKVWLLFLAAFPPITLATVSGVERVRPEFVEAARALGASRRQVVRVAVLPSVVPDVLTGIRLALGFAWTTIVAAETSNGIPGIGGLAWATKKELRSDVAVMCVIVIGITALVLDNGVRLLERRLAPWKGRA
jgi:taurine transport system permease protein